MKKIIIILLCVSFISGLVIFIFKEPSEITNFPGVGTTIVALGDSLVEGVGSTPGKDFVSILSLKIEEPIINMGVSGNTSVQGLARVDEVNAQDPKVVMVLFGGNDFLRKIPREETFKNIDDIVLKLQSEGAMVVLLGVKGGILSDGYEKYFKEIAENRGVLYVPNVLDGIFGNSKLMSDTIHPNDAGYEKIAEKIYPVLKKSLGLN